ncbi:hypothetical protein H5410_038769 [Solanum commersonii]|uniref:Uncharacterized protein n=1 Tax=Solanum commersonii TaxID=4109 RepID=A0A9J5YB27_SOLCO|nr:hypothetical protein H5410_038769 [Solanum commersonii]
MTPPLCFPFFSAQPRPGPAVATACTARVNDHIRSSSPSCEGEFTQSTTPSALAQSKSLCLVRVILYVAICDI